MENKEFKMTRTKKTDFEKKLLGRLKSATARLESAKSIDDLSPRLTVRRVVLDLEPRSVNGEEIKSIRQQLFNVSQAIFAQLIQVPKRTLEKWEQGTGKVPGPACVLLGDMVKSPDHWRKQFTQLLKRSEKQTKNLQQ